MKKLQYKLIIPACLAVFIVMYACSKNFLDAPPQGSLSLSTITTRSGVDALLIGAYALLDGENLPAPGLAYGSACSNWVWGSICADDSYKGSTPTDQPAATLVESWSISQATGAY